MLCKCCARNKKPTFKTLTNKAKQIAKTFLKGAKKVTMNTHEAQVRGDLSEE